MPNSPIGAVEEPLLTLTYKINSAASMAETQDWVHAGTLVLASVTRSPGGHLQTSHPCQGEQTPSVAALQSPPTSREGNCTGWHRGTLPTHGSLSGSSKQLLVFKARREQVWSGGTAVRTAHQREQALGVTHKFTADNNLRQTELFIVHRCFVSPHLLNSVHKIMPNTFKKCSQAFPSFLPFHMGLVLRCSVQAEIVHHKREYMTFFYLLSLKGVFARY